MFQPGLNTKLYLIYHFMKAEGAVARELTGSGKLWGTQLWADPGASGIQKFLKNLEENTRS